MQLEVPLGISPKLLSGFPSVVHFKVLSTVPSEISPKVVSLIHLRIISRVFFRKFQEFIRYFIWISLPRAFDYFQHLCFGNSSKASLEILQEYCQDFLQEVFLGIPTRILRVQVHSKIHSRVPLELLWKLLWKFFVRIFFFENS